MSAARVNLNSVQICLFVDDYVPKFNSAKLSAYPETQELLLGSRMKVETFAFQLLAKSKLVCSLFVILVVLYLSQFLYIS